MRILSTIAAVAALFTFAACDPDATNTDRPAREKRDSAPRLYDPEPPDDFATQDQDPDPEPALDDDAKDILFVELIRSEYPGMFLGVPDSQMIELGHMVCGQFDIGQTFVDVVTMGVESGYTYGQIGGFIGASTAAYCPNHSDVIQ